MKKKLLNKITISLTYSFILFLCLALIMLITSGITYIGTSLNLFDTFNTMDGMIITVITCLIVGMIITAITGPRMFKPFQKIIEAIEQLATGDFSVRLNLHNPHSFSRLSSSFNRMAEELGGIELLRNDFVNNFSHEFKTPIVSIKGFAEMLKYADLTEEERNEYLDIVISESSRLASLASNVLNMTKIETQSILTETQKFNIGEQLRECVILLEAKISDKKINLEASIVDMPYSGNKELLSQVWLNLLDNAVKFTPEGGSICISLRQSVTSIKAIIMDTGCGIDAKNSEHIFEKFYQTDTSHATAGNGIGLAVVKKIVELHGGEIQLQSEVNKGSTFTVILPLKTTLTKP